MSIDDFYNTQTKFISNLAFLLGIPTSRLMIATVVAGNRRRGLLTSSTAVTFMVYDNPASSATTIAEPYIDTSTNIDVQSAQIMLAVLQDPNGNATLKALYSSTDPSVNPYLATIASPVSLTMASSSTSVSFAAVTGVTLLQAMESLIAAINNGTAASVMGVQLIGSPSFTILAGTPILTPSGAYTNLTVLLTSTTTTTVVPGSTATSTNSSNSTSSNPPSPPPPITLATSLAQKQNFVPVIGGAVGGFGAVLLIAGGIMTWVILRRRKLAGKVVSSAGGGKSVLTGAMFASISDSIENLKSKPTLNKNGEAVLSWDRTITFKKGQDGGPDESIICSAPPLVGVDLAESPTTGATFKFPQFEKMSAQEIQQQLRHKPQLSGQGMDDMKLSEVDAGGWQPQSPLKTGFLFLPDIAQTSARTSAVASPQRNSPHLSSELFGEDQHVEVVELSASMLTHPSAATGPSSPAPASQHRQRDSNQGGLSPHPRRASYANPPSAAQPRLPSGGVGVMLDAAAFASRLLEGNHIRPRYLPPVSNDAAYNVMLSGMSSDAMHHYPGSLMGGGAQASDHSYSDLGPHCNRQNPVSPTHTPVSSGGGSEGVKRNNRAVSVSGGANPHRSMGGVSSSGAGGEDARQQQRSRAPSTAGGAPHSARRSSTLIMDDEMMLPGGIENQVVAAGELGGATIMASNEARGSVPRISQMGGGTRSSAVMLGMLSPRHDSPPL